MQKCKNAKMQIALGILFQLLEITLKDLNVYGKEKRGRNRKVEKI